MKNYVKMSSAIIRSCNIISSLHQQSQLLFASFRCAHHHLVTVYDFTRQDNLPQIQLT